MVTTIKITCDGVFIQSNSNQNNISNERIVARTTISVRNSEYHQSNSINHHHLNGRETSSIGIIDNNVEYIKSEPQSLPTFPIKEPETKLISPILVSSSLKTLSRVKKLTAAPTNCDKIVINTLPTTSISSSATLPSNKSIHKVIRIDRNGNVKCTARSSNSIRQWDGSKCNGSNASAAIRRRNTFKNYLIECKENLVRRLSSPTPLIG